MTSVGIDLGASTIHVVAVAGAPKPTVVAARTFVASEIDAVVAFVGGARSIAIDAPAAAEHRGAP